jgi:hypothetical protein
MGVLLQTLKESGKNLPATYKENTNYFGLAYSKANTDNGVVKTIDKGKMQKGRFYFLHYADDSTWMKYSPIMTVDFKRFNNMIVVQAINLNFIPMQIRALFFDKFIKNFEKDDQLNWVNYQRVYTELLKIGYEYALVEYNLAMVKTVHKIDISNINRFLYSGHPKVKYDPKKLYEIWSVKIETKRERHEEIMKFMLDDFYKIDEEMRSEYTELKGHIDRIQKNLTKYGGRSF